MFTSSVKIIYYICGKKVDVNLIDVSRTSTIVTRKRKHFRARLMHFITVIVPSIRKPTAEEIKIISQRITQNCIFLKAFGHFYKDIVMARFVKL